MKTIALTAALIALSSSLAVAQTPPPAEDKSLSTEAAKDHPATKDAGSTADPTAKSDDKSLSEKAAKDLPGTTGAGSTADPTAKPADSSLQDKAAKDQGSK
jgi:hypothetical protein